ncbi:hypothetical protein H0H92_008386 [Tricholoma furcatifolium]|nr:hypothetical protein H0H92_008386 [Tricholoma furcatifolium]
MNVVQSVSADTPLLSPVSTESLEVEVAQTSTEEIKDVVYYLEFITLLAEDRLFKVPKYHFVRYPGQLEWMKGADEDTPHKLENVPAGDLQALLKLMYPLNSPSQQSFSCHEWASILKLASLWMMLDFRKKAIEALADEEWLKKILLSRECAVFAWVRDVYNHLIQRKQPLTIDEARQLGLEVAVKLFELRLGDLQRNNQNELHYEYYGFYPSVTPEMHTTSYAHVVDTELAGEIGHSTCCPRGSDAVERIVWARLQNNPDWLRLAFIDLVERDTPLSLEEALKLGFDTAINVCRAREKALQSRSLPSYYPKTIDDVFRDEFSKVRARSECYAPKPSHSPFEETSACDASGEMVKR